MRPGLSSLILHIILFIILIPAIIHHIINSNTFGLITGFIVEGCWLTSAINDILYLAAQRKQDKQDKE